MLLLTVLGTIAGYALSRVFAPLGKTFDISPAATTANKYASRLRKSSIVRQATRFLIPILVACLVLWFAITLLSRTNQSPIRRIGQTASSASRGAIQDYLNSHERLVEVDRMYQPESIVGAKLLGDGMWWDAGGEYALLAFEPAGPGRGYCDSTCKSCVRVEYRVDEGFGRIEEKDRVFFLTKDGRVTGHVPTSYVRFGNVRTNDADLREAEEFFSGGMDSGL
jgi:hypothetical protein